MKPELLRIILPLTLAIGLAACTPAPPAEETTAEDTTAGNTAAPAGTAVPEQDTGAVGLLRDQYIAAVNDGELDKVASFWSEDGVLMPPGQPAAVGKQAVVAWYQNMFGQVDADIDIRSAESQIVGDWAYDRGTFTMTLAPKPAGVTGAGAPAGTPPGPAAADVKTPASPQTYNYLVMMRRDAGGSWKLARNIWSPEGMPAPGAAGPGAPKP
jgi:ketosteroid isomerase-like protein